MYIPPSYHVDAIYYELYEDGGPALLFGFGLEVPLCERFSLLAYIDHTWHRYYESDVLDYFDYTSAYIGIDWYFLNKWSR